MQLTSPVWAAVGTLRLRAALLLFPFMLGFGTPDLPAAQVSTSVLLNALPASVQWPKPVTLSARVDAGVNSISPGTVNFCVAGAASCQGSALLGTVQLTSSGQANLNTVLGIGSHLIYARFAGTQTAAPSQSSVINVTVSGKYATTTTLTANGTQPYSFTSVVTESSTSPPTGLVSFANRSLNQALGTATLFPLSSNWFFTGTNLAGIPGSGSKPGPLITADFNGDGLPDIVAANTMPDSGGIYTLTVLLSISPGVYAAPQSVALPGIVLGMGGLATGDFNNDGKLDLVATGVGGVLDILFGNGNGTFVAASISLPAPSSDPNAIAVGDFNRDGYADLAITDLSQSKVTIMLGSGMGQFTAGQMVPTGTYPQAIATADFNSDGLPDLVIPNYFSNNATVLLGKGDGTFTPGTAVPTGVYPDAVVIGDFNGDGKADIAIANQFSKTVDVFLGNGSGAFAAPSASGYTPIAVNAQPYSLASADFNGDGVPDLAIGNSGQNGALLLLGKGDGTFSSAPGIATLPTPGSLGQISAIDINGDGRPDAVEANYNATGVSLAVNTPQSTATATLSNVTVYGISSQNTGAFYPGDARDASSSSASVAVPGMPVTLSVALVVTPGTTVYAGQRVQLTAVLTPSLRGLYANGDVVNFYNSGTQIASAVVVGNIAVADVTFAAGSSPVLTASFLGDSRLFPPSQSHPVTVNAVAPQLSTSTALTVSSNSTSSAKPITLTASVTAGGKPVNRGWVVFVNSNVPFENRFLGKVQLNSSGTAVLKKFLPVGTTAAQAFFSGSLQYTASNSTAQTIVVSGSYPSTTTLSVSGSPGNYFMSATASAHVSLPAANIRVTDTSNKNLVIGTLAGTGLIRDDAFTVAGNVAVSAYPLNIGSADVNKDGRPDAIVANGSVLQVLIGNGDGTLNAPATTIAGSYFSFSLSDFNADGNIDIAAVNGDTAAIDIFLGNGDGTFTLKASLIPGSANSELVVGDFNLDGIQDIAAGNVANNTVNILLGNGDGTFTADPVTPTANNPGPIVVADFNSDGYPDLAVIDYTGKVNILGGTGDGHFTSRATFSSGGTAPTSIKLGDFNGDTVPDLLIVNSAGGNMEVLFGDGKGNFTAQPIAPAYTGPYAVVAADFNNDGISDFIVSDGQGATSSIYYGIGSGLFSAPSVFPNFGNAGGIAAVDLDGNGSLDLVYTQKSSNMVVSLLSTTSLSGSISNVAVFGGGTHQLTATYAGAPPVTGSTSAAASATGSLIPAMVALSVPSQAAAGASLQITAAVFPASANSYTTSGTVTLSNGTTVLGTVPLVNSQATFSVTMPASGSLSLKATYSGDTNFSSASSLLSTVGIAMPSATKLLLSSATAAAGASVTLTATVTAGGTWVTAGIVKFCDAAAARCQDSALLGTSSLNAKGAAVLLLRPGIGQHNYMAVFQPTKSILGSTSAAQTLSVTGLIATTTNLAVTSGTSTRSFAASVTANGFAVPAGNVSFVNPSNNAILATAALGSGTTRFSMMPSSVTSTVNTSWQLAAADFNGDGKTDVAVTNIGSSIVTILLGKGDGNFLTGASYPVASEPTGITTGDFNSDGIPDLAVAGFASGSVTVLLGTGQGTFTAAPAIANPQGALDVAAVDVDGDGKLDLAITSPSSTGVRIYFGKGDGTFTPGPSTTVPNTLMYQIVSGDFNGDGRVDLALCAADLNGNGNVSILLGNGDGNFVVFGVLPTGGIPVLSIGDFNRDGKQDIVAVDPNAGMLYFWPGNGNGSFGTAVRSASGLAIAVDMQSGDFNGDGIEDLVLEGSTAIEMLFGTGNGTFTPGPTAPLGSPNYAARSLAGGDFNGDGRLDLAIASYSGNNVTSILNTTTMMASASAMNITVPATVSTAQAHYSGTATLAPSVSSSVILPPLP